MAQSEPPTELLPERTATASGFGAVLTQFLDTLEGIRELLEVALPAVGELDRPESVLRRHLTLLPEDQRGPALEAIRLVIDALQRPTEPDSHSEGNSPAAGAAPDGDGLGAAVLKLLDVTGDATAALYLLGRLEAPKRLPRSKLMARALVPVAVGALDVLLAGLVREFTRRYPNALWDSRQAVITVEALRALGSVEAAVESATDARIDELLRLSLDDFVAVLYARLKIRAESHALEWSALREVIERRHAIIHHGGRASTQYLNKTGLAMPLGAELTVDEGYIGRALDEVVVFGVLLSFDLWERAFAGETEMRAGLLNRDPGVVFDLMTLGRWHAVAAVTEKALELRLPTSDLDILRANRFLAQKRLGTLNRDELLAWDVSAKGRVHAIAKMALLDELDYAIPLIDLCVARGEIEPKDLMGWPLFEELRARPDYADVLRRARDSWDKLMDEDDSDD